MSEYGFSVETIETDIPSERKPVEEFLRRLDLFYDQDVDYTVVVRDGGKILSTGSLAGNILKCIGVDPSVRGEAFTNTVVTQLEMEAYRRGLEQLFLFSRPKNRSVFEGLGFEVVGEYPDEVVLMEKPGGGLDSWAEGLLSFGSPGGELVRSAEDDSGAGSAEGVVITAGTTEVAGTTCAESAGTSERTGGPSTALVMNCNPFTLGHRYLAEQASARAAADAQIVHLFVVSEDRSLFPERIRRRLVEEGTADLENVRVHSGGPYIISNATFPSYFARDEGEATRMHAGLDVHIFGSRIAPLFHIKRRMVGEEPYCPVTAAYNEAMKSILPGYGIRVQELPRLKKGGRAVSASVVRELIREDRLEEAGALVPQSTWTYLSSEEFLPVRERIRRELRRH